MLIDGIDEILDTGRRLKVLEAIDFRRGADKYRFLIASRPLADREFSKLLKGGIGAYEILPFSSDQLLLLAQTWFRSLGLHRPESHAEKFRADLERSRIARIACVPLIASMLCVVFAEDPDRGIPESRADLYEQFIELLMSKQHEHVDIYKNLPNYAAKYGTVAREAVERLLQAGRTLIERLAYRRYSRDMRPSLDLLMEWTRPFCPGNVSKAEWRYILAEMLRQSGLMVQRQSDFVFLHQTLEEYLAAAHEARNISSDVANHLVLKESIRELSYRLFLAAICSRQGIDFNTGVLDMLQHGPAPNALFVAAMLRDGIQLSSDVIEATVERLERVATATSATHTYSLEMIIEAAHELAFLDPEKGQRALQSITKSRRLSSYDRVEAARKLVDLDFASGVKLLDDYANDKSIGGTERILAANYLLELEFERGVVALSHLCQNRRLNGWTRLELADQIVQLNRPLAIEALTYLANDPELEDYCRYEAREELQRLSVPVRGIGIPYVDRIVAPRSTYAFDAFYELRREDFSLENISRVAVTLSNPDLDGFLKSLITREVPEADPDEMLQWGVDTYEDASFAVFLSGIPADLADAMDNSDRSITARRLVRSLHEHGNRERSLETSVRLEMLLRCTFYASRATRMLGVAMILEDLCADLLEAGAVKPALTAINSALAIYRKLASLSAVKGSYGVRITSSATKRANIRKVYRLLSAV